MKRAEDWRRRLADWLVADSGVLSLRGLVGPDALRERLVDAGYAPVLIDFAPIADKAALMVAMRAALALDDWFGANWDALADALFGPETPTERATVLILQLPPSGPALDEADFRTLLQIVRDVAGSARSTLKGAILLGGSPFRDWV